MIAYLPSPNHLPHPNPETLPPIYRDDTTVNVVWTAVSPGKPIDITVSCFSTTDPVLGARGTALITSNTTGTYSIRSLPPGCGETLQVPTTSHSPPRTANVTVPPGTQTPKSNSSESEVLASASNYSPRRTDSVDEPLEG